MTEAEWLAGGDIGAAGVGDMLDHAEDCGGERKLRLFAVCCCRHVRGQLADRRSRAAVAAAERYADGRCSAADLAACLADAAAVFQELDAARAGLTHSRATNPAWQDNLTRSTAAAVAACAVNPRMGRTPAERKAAPPSSLSAVGSAAHHARHVAAWVGPPDRAGARAQEQIRLLRDLFGNPFRPVAFAPTWRTDTTVAIARGMHEARDFAAMPILADALQDAGCDDEGVLAHCRDANAVHVRGCWVADLVLGK